MIYRIEKWVATVAAAFNWVAAAAVASMMVITCLDVVLRLFRRPIPGTYEIVGFLGAVFASFSLGYTSLQRGHIAVDFLVQKLGARPQAALDALNAFICSVLFGLLTHQCLGYAADLRAAGEVSMTLQMPVYPFVYGLAAGCLLLSVVLAVQTLKRLTRAMQA